MSFAEKNRIFLEKLRNLSEPKKKIILWTVVVVLALGMGYFWVNGAIKGFSKLSESAKSVKLPSFDLPNMPAMPSLNSILQTTTPTNK